MVAYGGDEVSALVVDIGASTTRVGYAGDDVPKAIIPTSYGFVLEKDPTNPESQRVSQIHVGEHGPSVWRAGQEIANPIQNGLVADWPGVSSLLGHAFVKSLRADPSHHPVLVTEPPWNTPANREKMAEIMFEEFKVPAFYIANSGVLSAFSAGKGTALIIDIGRSSASVTPVVDGFVLRKGIAHSHLPMLLYANVHHLLTKPGAFRQSGIGLIPHQLIATKMPVPPEQPPRITLRQERVQATTDSWRHWAEHREVEEWVAGVASVLDNGWNEQQAQARQAKTYEFQSGFNTSFGPERYIPGEMYFNNSHLAAANPNLPKTIPQLLIGSLSACEPDLRTQLLQNVVLTGGGSFLTGLNDRINNEMMRNFNGKVKLHAAGNNIERKYGAWLGGSILASLGTFHQLWISAEEWQEHGRAIVSQRCK